MNARRSRTRLSVTLVVLAQIAVASSAHAVTNTVVTTISVSRQFAASANDPVLPSALCVYAEQVKREWLARMDVTDVWRDPILLVMRPRAAAQTNMPAIWMAVFQTDEHLKYQIHCLIPPRIDETELLTMIVDALCSEWANRAQITVSGNPRTVPAMPPWLVQGLAASIQGRYEFLLSIAQRSVEAGRPQQAADLLDTSVLPFDPMDRELFRADAWIFTESLLALPDGPRKLRRFLTTLGEQKVASNAFWRVYQQDFPEPITLDKWWSLEQARRVSVSLAQDLSVQETTRRLDSILLTRLDCATERGGKTDELKVAINNLWRYADAPWLKDVVKLKIDRLGTLRSQAHPLYQPVVDKYIDAATWLYRGSAVRFRRGVDNAEAAQAAVEKQSARIAAYMDQAERIYTPQELSKVLASYLQTLAQFQKIEDGRRNPISDYLDKFDQ